MLTSLLLGIFFVGIQAAFACSCFEAHPQVQFCTSDFVIEARINSEEIIDWTKYYNFTLNKVHKTTQEASNAIITGRLETEVDSAACGAYLQSGQTYVLAGRVINDSLKISSCDFYQTTKTLTDFQKDNFNNSYAENCNCNIITESNSISNNQTCLWNTFSYNGYSEDCQVKYAVCKYNGDSCNWEGNQSYEKCYNKEL